MLAGADFSDRLGILAFGWSRMCVHDELSVAGKVNTEHLTFEGFLEALCRMSALKALPTPEDVESAEERDAGTFLVKLEANDAR